jgi:hypothetical protein
MVNSVSKIQTIGTRCRSMPNTNSITVLEPFRLEVDKLIKASVEYNTLNMYNKGLENFNNIRIKMRLRLSIILRPTKNCVGSEKPEICK